MSSYAMNFARTGSPNDDGTPAFNALDRHPTPVAR
jgi:hypothetical protein